MDLFALAGLAGMYALLVPVISFCVGLLLLYGVIRVAVARGMRDHYVWVEKNRPRGYEPQQPRESMGQYLGFSSPSPSHQGAGVDPTTPL